MSLFEKHLCTPLLQAVLCEAELIYTIGSLIIAGHSTTTHLIATGLVQLLQKPGCWRTLCEHPEYIPQTVEEILRYDGPVRGFMRVTTRPIPLHGIELEEVIFTL